MNLFKMLSNNSGCFGGGKKPETPKPIAPPPPAPTPIAPSNVEGQVADEERRRKLERTRRGLASTIKSKSRNLLAGADVAEATLAGGKQKLGV